MKIQGDYHFDSPRDDVWTALLDPDVLAATVPGSQGLERTGDNSYQGKLKIKVGPVQGLFEGKVSLSDLDPPNGYRMTIEGRGPAGFMNGTGSLALSEAAGGTDMHYDVDAKVGGRIAGVGQRLLDSSAKVITRQALAALDGQIQARSGHLAAQPEGEAAPPASGLPPASPPSQVEFVAEVAKGVAQDMIPRPYRRLLAMAGAGLGAALVVLMIRACA